MTEEVREALMRLTMCAREECGMCKYKDECDFDFQYKISTDNMNTLSDALMRSRCEVDAKSAEAYFTDGNKIAEWIPCSESLPSEDGCYLVCMAWDHCVMEVLRWTDGWNCYRSYDGKVERESEIDRVDIIAWMPLPEPYREENEA